MNENSPSSEDKPCIGQCFSGADSETKDSPAGASKGNDKDLNVDKTNMYAVTHDVQLIYETDAAAFEAELNKHCIQCDKNPGHPNFIPMEDFSLDNIPEKYRTDSLLEVVRLQGEVTVRIRLTCTSAARPDTFPQTQEKNHYPYYEPGASYPFKDLAGTNWGRVGTGFVSGVERGGDWQEDPSMEGPCPCRQGCPEKNWARFFVDTALHLVYNQEEADCAEMEFFFNTDQDRRKKKTKTIKGGKIVVSSMEGDRCALHCYTHDLLLIARVMVADMQRMILCSELLEFFAPEASPVIIVSHPHGCGKVVTLGELTEQKDGRYNNRVASYSTPTCPGCSGAPVLWWGKDEAVDRPILTTNAPSHSGFVKLDGKIVGRCGQWL